MECLIGGYITVGVPQWPGEGVLAAVLLGDVQYISPGGRYMMTDVHVVDRDYFSPELQEKLKVVSRITTVCDYWYVIPIRNYK